jgi:probable lipoprotein (TIGR04455 family)
MKTPLSLLGLAAAGALLSGCATVKAHHVAPDYTTRYRAQVKRLAVMTSPAPEGSPELARLWSLIARRYVNQKYDYIVKPTEAQAQAPAGLCAAMTEDPINGVLWLIPAESLKEGDVSASVTARLVACDGGEVWSARGEGSWDAQDDQLQAFTADYVRELGEPVKPYVAPTFRLLKSVLDTLPTPAKLTDEETDEKIEATAE